MVFHRQQQSKTMIKSVSVSGVRSIRSTEHSFSTWHWANCAAVLVVERGYFHLRHLQPSCGDATTTTTTTHLAPRVPGTRTRRKPFLMKPLQIVLSAFPDQLSIGNSRNLQTIATHACLRHGEWWIWATLMGWLINCVFDFSMSAGVQQQLVIKEEVQEEREWNPSLDHEDPDGPYIKEENEDLWTSNEVTVHPQGLHDEDTTGFLFSHVKSEDAEKKTQPQQFQSRVQEPPASSSPEHIKTEADGQDCGEPEPHRVLVASLSTCDETMPHYPGADAMVIGDDLSEIRKQRDLNNRINRIPVTVTNSTNKSFTCSKCGKKFGQKHHLLTHLRCHTGEKPFSCSLCGRRFSQKGNLTQHAMIHTREKPCSCPVCGERFAQKGNLTQHLTVHTRENPCTCPVCGETFAQKGTLAQHLTIHAREKPCSCPVCGERFVQKGNLTQHLTVHAREKCCWWETYRCVPHKI